MNLRQGIAVTVTVAGTYAWFLLFAQFAFLEIAKGIVEEGVWLKAIMGAMAVGGVGMGFLVARFANNLLRWIAVSFAAAAGVSAWAAVAADRITLLFVAFATGASLAVTTVALAGVLGGVRNQKRACLWVGLGTGLGYAWCNLPFVFQAAPKTQALLSSGVAMLSAVAVMGLPRAESPLGQRTIPWRMLAVFSALVWMDSAAFYIIQHTEDLKHATWNEGMLMRNALVHFAAAAVAGWWLAKGGCRWLLAMAWLLIALASWWAQEPAMRLWAGWLYPAGVSLYSTALTAWPGLLAEDTPGPSRHPALWRAAWLFGCAGWLASGAGIVMADGRQKIPLAWLLIAGGIVLWNLWRRTSPFSSHRPNG